MMKKKFILISFLIALSVHAQNIQTQINDSLGAKILFQKGFEFWDNGDKDSAMICFDHAIMLDPSERAFYAYRAKAYNVLGRNEEAMQDITKAIGKSTNHYPFYKIRADIWYALKYYNKANADYRKALYGTEPEQNFELLEECTQIAITYKFMEDYSNAIKYLKMAIEIDSGIAGFYAELGLDYFMNGDYRNAVQYISLFETKSLNNNFSEEYENWAELYLAKGISYIYTDDYNKAIEYLDKSKQIKILPEIYIRIGQALEGNKEFEKAESSYQKSLSEFPRLKEAYAYYAWMEYKQNNCEKSAGLYEHLFASIDSIKPYSKYYTGYALAEGCLKDTETALEIFQYGFQALPNSNDLLYSRILFLNDNFNYLSVQKQDVQKILQTNFNGASKSFLLTILASIYIKEADTANSMQMLNKALSSLDIDSANGLYNQAVLYFYYYSFDKQHIELIIRNLNETIRMNKYFHQAYALLSMTYHRMGDDKKAKNILKTAYDTCPDNRFKSATQEFKTLKSIMDERHFESTKKAFNDQTLPYLNVANNIKTE